MVKLPTWYRAFAIVVGVFSIGLALIVLVDPFLAIWLLIFFLALALLTIGMDRLIAGVTGHPFGWMGPMGPGGMMGGPSSPPGNSPPPSHP